MEESASTKNQIDIPGGDEERNDELITEITKMINRPEIQILSSTPCRIYKVPRLLRCRKEEAYTPQEVSIGPFHHKDERLKAMEEHKERYFKSFVRRCRINVVDLVGIIRELEESIRGCYEETVDLTSDMFVRMILVDACFILELLCKCCPNGLTSDDPMFVQLRDDPVFAQQRANAVMHDLLLLENQLPIFVIEKLYHLASPYLPGSLLGLSFGYFQYFNMQFLKPHPDVKIEHFTDLLRTFLIPPLEKLPRRVNRRVRHFYSATQLNDAGVKFKVSTSNGFFDLKFERGVLKIPGFKFDDWSEVVIRNIMALEQTRYIETAYFTDYFLLIDSLIKTRKDVDLLCEKKVLVNNLGDNDAAKSMVSNLTRGILWVSMGDEYDDLFRNMNYFCESPLQNLRVEIKRGYFATPSQATSTIVSLGVITVLTLIQTVCSIMQVTGSS